MDQQTNKNKKTEQNNKQVEIKTKHNRTKINMLLDTCMISDTLVHL